MPHVSCDRCGTRIVEHATMVVREGMHFCCPNCAELTLGDPVGATGSCAHCAAPIVELRTKVEQDEWVFCCTNCEQAMATAAPRRSAR